LLWNATATSAARPLARHACVYCCGACVSFARVVRGRRACVRVCVCVCLSAWQCSSCSKAETEALTAARSYHRSLDGAPPAVFFVSVDYESCPTGFRLVRLCMMPRLARALGVHALPWCDG
jgi:hypothetical protein